MLTAAAGERHFALGGSGTAMTLTGIEVAGGDATGTFLGGGAASVAGGGTTLTASDCVFRNNEAGNCALSFHFGGVGSFTSCTFVDNERFGAICQFTASSVTLTDCMFSGNTQSGVNDYAIHIDDGDSTLTCSATTESCESGAVDTVACSDGDGNDCSPSCSACRAPLPQAEVTSQSELQDAVDNGQTAIVTHSFALTAALLVPSGADWVIQGDDSLVNPPVLTAANGARHFTLSESDSSLTLTHLKLSGGSTSAALGGGSVVVAAPTAALTATGVAFHNNSASKGSACAVRSGGTAMFTTCEFTDNDREQGSGTVYVDGSSAASISSCLFTGNVDTCGGNHADVYAVDAGDLSCSAAAASCDGGDTTTTICQDGANDDAACDPACAACGTVPSDAGTDPCPSAGTSSGSSDGRSGSGDSSGDVDDGVAALFLSWTALVTTGTAACAAVTVSQFAV